MNPNQKYSYLLTNDDLERFHRMVNLLHSAIDGVFFRRKLAEVDDLDDEPTLAELLYYELSCEIDEDQHLRGGSSRKP